LKATVVITSKNRCADLATAITSCLWQTAEPEIIVIDDGSTDETPLEIPSRFPTIRFVRHECSKGYIHRRNEGAALATGDVIFSIDDDAEFSSRYVVAQALSDFQAPRIGALAIPLIEPKRHDSVLQQAPDDTDIWVTDTFKGTAYAIKKSCFHAVGGFRTFLVHQGEESDLCIRLLNQGVFVRLSRADPIIHHESPKRDLRRMHYYGRRNDILFAVNNVPGRLAAIHMLATTVKGVRTALCAKQPSAMFKGLWKGWQEGLSLLRSRQPVSAMAYRVFRTLRKKGPCRLSELEHLVKLVPALEWRGCD
jgi:glycosyltransferase involved in cell wall biosynthesis